MVSEVSVHLGGQGIEEQSSSCHMARRQREDVLASSSFLVPFIAPRLPPYGMAPPMFRFPAWKLPHKHTRRRAL
jgi:hypothetical protein